MTDRLPMLLLALCLATPAAAQDAPAKPKSDDKAAPTSPDPKSDKGQGEQKDKPKDKGVKLDKDKKLDEIGLLKRSPETLCTVLESSGETDILLARRELERWGKKAGPALADLLGRTKRNLALTNALELLIDMGGHPDAEDPLIALFTRKIKGSEVTASVEEVHRLSARCLGVMRSEKALPVLINSLEHPEWVVISEAARVGLGLYGPEHVSTVVKTYRKLLASGADASEDGIIFRSLLAIGVMGGSEARRVLLEALTEESRPDAVALRHHAAIGLASLKDRSTVEVLVKRLEKEPDHYVQKYIARALQSVTGVDLPPDPIRWMGWWRRNSKDYETSSSDSGLGDISVPVPKLPKAFRERVEARKKAEREAREKAAKEGKGGKDGKDGKDGSSGADKSGE